MTKKEKVQLVIKWIVAILIVITVGVFAVMGGVNLGGLVNKLLGKKKKQRAFLTSEGNLIGSEIDFINRKNPFRDRSILKTTDGKEISLPSGVHDTDVKSLIKVKIKAGEGNYAVVKKHDSLTDIFDD